jgi:excisionase family DNA binding protein
MANYLTTQQVAKKLGLTESLVRRYCRQGKLKGEKRHGGSGWDIAPQEVARFSKIPRKIGRPKRVA